MQKIILTFFLCVFIYHPVVSQGKERLKRFEFSHGQMGTIFNIVCYSDDTAAVRAVADRVFAMIDSLNLVFSDYNPESELNRLCLKSGNGKYIKVSKSLFDMIRTSLCWSKRSRGIFDITVGPYTQLWRRAIRRDEKPDPDRLARASESVGYRNIKLRRKTQSVKLKKKNMQLDLGGIAKGYTVDRIYKFLVANGIKICLVDGGGDIYAGQKPPGDEGWKVQFQELGDTKKFMTLTHRAVATSGDLYRFFEYKGTKFSHIIDPGTGMGITAPRTVSVLAPDATTADALATILSIDGPGKGFKLLKKLKDVGALIVQQEGDNIKTYQYGDLVLK